MKELTARNVTDTLMYCLFDDDEPRDGAVTGQGVAHDFGFHPGRLKEVEQDVIDYLAQLPRAFRKDSDDGGASFLMACTTEDGRQWGEHPDAEALFALGTAIGVAKCPLPRLMWPALPGSVPYYAVDIDGRGPDETAG